MEEALFCSEEAMREGVRMLRGSHAEEGNAKSSKVSVRIHALHKFVTPRVVVDTYVRVHADHLAQ